MEQKRIVQPSYGTKVTIKRLSGLYNCSVAKITSVIARAEFWKYFIKGSYPRQWVYTRELEMMMDKWLNMKGIYRCTGSKVRSKYSLEKESSSLT